MEKSLQKKDYRITLDELTGKWTGLYDRFQPEANWLAQNEKIGFCTSFVHGTQFGEDHLVCPLQLSEKGLYGLPQSGVTELTIEAEDEIIRGCFRTPVDNGPRIGLQMNLSFLDLPCEGPWRQQCMPKIIYEDENYAFAYFVFATVDHRYLILTVSTPLAAWRIHYSYEGHRMTAFQLLTQADDVRTDGRKSLPVAGELEFQIQFADAISDCLPKISQVLHQAIAVPRISGGPVGAHIPFDILGDCMKIYIQDPEGEVSEPERDTVALCKRGIYQVIAVSQNGREHISRILCHEGWEEQFDRVNQFHRAYMQHESGAFYRAITADTRLPDHDVVGGCAMGDPFSHYSCRTGEFGGFASWSMIKNELLFGPKMQLHEAVERYLYHWALNRGHEDRPYFGTLYKKPHSYLGRDFGAYHIFEEYNYMQHEIFLLEEMADFYRLTGDKSVQEDALALIEHIAAEHIRSDGAVMNQNFPDEPGVDYSTVHIAVCGFLRWAEILKKEKSEKATRLCEIAERIADHVSRRRLDFPTEGEPCTEDGSMSCAVATLLYCYTQISPKPEYLSVAKEILDAHHVLELDGIDCRMKNSSLRFWETQYETRDWGASINAGHAWTIWTAEAKAGLALIENDISLLQESYEGFITNICKVSECGGMYCCYTPDMIPGTPHAYYLEGMTDQSLEHNDLRPTTTHLGMAYPMATFAVSGNYYLIKAAEVWSHISGLDCHAGVAINGIYEDYVFRSSAIHMDCLLISGKCSEKIWICCEKQKKMNIRTTENLQITGAEILDSDENGYTVWCSHTQFGICFCD